MSKKSKKQQETPEKKSGPSIENYYDLKTDAVDRLVNAKDAPEVSDEEIRKYTSKGKFHIPEWLKIVFIKFWFSGAICYFFLWGLGLYLDRLDLMFVLTVGLGVTMDLMVNHVLHYFEPQKGAYDKWMMITTRKWWSFFANIPYAGLLLFCVIQAYTVINTLLVGDVTTAESVAIGVEPVLFGLFYMGFDMLFIAIKNTLIKVFRDAEKKASGSK